MDVRGANLLERTEGEILIGAPPHQPVAIGGTLEHRASHRRQAREQLLARLHYGLVSGVLIGGADGDFGLGPGRRQLAVTWGNSVGPKNISLDIAIGAVTESGRRR